MGWFRKTKDEPVIESSTEDVTGEDQMARLEQAEAEVADLKRRAGAAIRVLDARRSRNHWRESIEQMIQGA